MGYFGGSSGVGAEWLPWITSDDMDSMTPVDPGNITDSVSETDGVWTWQFTPDNTVRDGIVEGAYVLSSTYLADAGWGDDDCGSVHVLCMEDTTATDNTDSPMAGFAVMHDDQANAGVGFGLEWSGGSNRYGTCFASTQNFSSVASDSTRGVYGVADLPQGTTSVARAARAVGWPIDGSGAILIQSIAGQVAYGFASADWTDVSKIQAAMFVANDAAGTTQTTLKFKARAMVVPRPALEVS